MKKTFALLVLVMFSVNTIAFSEELPDLPGLAQEGGRIVGSMEIGRDYPLQVDMPLPKAVEGPIKQYKMERVQITKPEAIALLNGKTMPAKPGERWEISTLPLTEYRQFHYQAEGLLYETFYPPSPPLPLDNETQHPALDLANQQAQALLEAWGIPYAYPFYQVCNAARGADVSLRGTPLRTGGEVEKYLLNHDSSEARYECKW